MTVHFIGAGPGAADLLTLRGQALLAACPVCLYAGSTVSDAVLGFCRPGARVVDTAPLSLDDIVGICAEADAAGQDVARLQSGDLACYSAVGEQAARLKALGIAVTMTPGVSALGAAAASIGRELTVPGVAQSVVVTRLSGRATTVPESLEALAATGSVLALHLSVNRLEEIAARLGKVLGAACPAVVVERASWPEERIWQGTLERLGEAGAATRMGLVLVGWSLQERGPEAAVPESALYSADYRRRFRPG